MQIALNSASYFGKASGYQTSIDQWGAAERRVIETASLREFDQLCAQVAGAGFRYLELWMAHAFPKHLTPDLAAEMRQIWERHGLTVISYSCSLGDPIRWPRWTRLCFEAAKMLGIGLITSGISREAAPVVYAHCREYGIKVAVENHPEKHPDEIRAVIGSYGDLLGACVDTGWFATQGYSAPEAIRALQDHLLHVHLKDVAAAGRHDCVRLGTGVAAIADCVGALQAIGYTGTVAVEQESGHFDPTADCAAGLRLVESLVALHM